MALLVLGSQPRDFAFELRMRLQPGALGFFPEACLGFGANADRLDLERASGGFLCRRLHVAGGLLANRLGLLLCLRLQAARGFGLLADVGELRRQPRL